VKDDKESAEKAFRTTQRVIGMRKKKLVRSKTNKITPEHGLFDITSNSKFKNQGEIHCPSGREFMRKVGESGLNRR
jgi:hypothetical protein